MSLLNVRPCDFSGRCRRAGSLVTRLLALVALVSAMSSAARAAEVQVVLAGDGRSCTVVAPSAPPADASLQVLHRKTTWVDACRAAASEPRCPMYSAGAVAACLEPDRHPLPRRVLAMRPIDNAAIAAPLDVDRLFRGRLANTYVDLTRRLTRWQAVSLTSAKELERRIGNASDVLFKDSSLSLSARIAKAYDVLIDPGQSGRPPHTTGLEAFPAAMNLWVDGARACGSTVIGERMLLTAAHCISRNVKDTGGKITLERQCAGSAAERHEAKCTFHPRYSHCKADVPCAFDLAICSTARPIACSGVVARLATNAMSASTPLFLFGHLDGTPASYRIAEPDPVAPVALAACAEGIAQAGSLLKVGTENGPPYLPYLTQTDSGHAVYADGTEAPNGLLVVGINLAHMGYASFTAQASCGYVQTYVNGP